MRIGIIGAGAWGTALAVSASRAGHDIILWEFAGQNVKNMQFGRESDYLPGVKLAKNIEITENLADLGGCYAWIATTPSDYFTEIMQKSRSFWQNQSIIICTKGMADDKFMSEILIDLDYFPGRIGVLAGPQFANDVANGGKTGCTVAGNAEIINAARKIFPEFYIQESDDIIGAQVCGAGKNAVAILMGYLDGCGESESMRALKLAVLWAEIVQIGRVLGAKEQTFLGICGTGDLFLTATSRTSRNYTAGLAIANGETPCGTVEGISAIHGIIKIAQTRGLLTPNLDFLAGIIL
ncbi:MAG: hypothetical protein FWE52_02345 [Alphaproteobacteria bacterium]|nr:hypothetical protein [Alphaproteobacteria bacterium]